MSISEYGKRLAAVLNEHEATVCPGCQHPIGWGDIAWNNGSTEAGTPMAWIEIQCSICQREVAGIWSWWPEIDENNFERDVVCILEQDWHD